MSTYTIEMLNKLMELNHGNIELSAKKISKFPDKLIVSGNLDLSFATIKELGNNLVVKGNLYLDDVTIEKLPETLYVFGDLYLRNAKVKNMPTALTVDGKLYLEHSNINYLPEGLTVGEICLERSKITHIPTNTYIKGDLDLSTFTRIKTFGEDVTIEGRLYLPNYRNDLELNPSLVVLGGVMKMIKEKK